MRYIVEKYRVNGKDYLLFDTNQNKYELTPHKVRRLCRHQFGVGVHGVIMASYENRMSVSAKVYNTEGMIDEQDYDGICAFAQYLKDKSYLTEQPVVLKTNHERIEIERVSAALINGTQNTAIQNASQIRLVLHCSECRMAAGSECINAGDFVTYSPTKVKETGCIMMSAEFVESL